MDSNGIPTPPMESPTLHDHNNDDNADTSEAVPAQTENIIQSDHVTMNTKGYETKQNFSKKRKRQSISSKRTCVFCEKKYVSLYLLDTHIRSHTDERGFICRICLHEYKHKRSLLLHRRSRHYREKNAPAPKMCKICGRCFERRACLSKHVKIVHEKLQPHKCDICDKRFSHKISLQRHQNVHAVHDKPERLYGCDTCEKKFVWYSSLKKHKWVVHNEIKRRLPKPKTLPPTGPHICEFCGKTFALRSNIRTHIRIVHEGIKRKRPRRSKSYSYPLKEAHVCHLCGKTVSSRKIGLAQHLNEHHRLEIDDSLKMEKRFKCSVSNCHSAFYEKADLGRHMLIHIGEKKFKCDQCGKSFLFPFQLRRHKECHKEVRPYVCAHCGKGFNYKFRLAGHVKKYHSSDNVTLA